MVMCWFFSSISNFLKVSKKRPKLSGRRVDIFGINFYDMSGTHTKIKYLLPINRRRRMTPSFGLKNQEPAKRPLTGSNAVFWIK